MIPFDNNIAQRNLSPVPGSSGKQERSYRIINNFNFPITVELDIKHNLPKGWSFEFDVPDIKNIRLYPYKEKRIKLRVMIPPDLAFSKKNDKARITITTLIDGIPDGGMTFDFVHPSLYPEEYKPSKFCCLLRAFRYCFSIKKKKKS